MGVPRDDGGICKEEDPDAVPALAVRLEDLVLVGDPVEVPPVERGRVMNAEDINVLDLEASRLQLVDDPAEGARGISAGEDIFVHEKTPTT